MQSVKLKVVIVKIYFLLMFKNFFEKKTPPAEELSPAEEPVDGQIESPQRQPQFVDPDTGVLVTEEEYRDLMKKRREEQR